MRKQKVELLAPAGNFSCFRAAVNAGADAVYLGVNNTVPGHMQATSLLRKFWMHCVLHICFDEKYI